MRLLWILLGFVLGVAASFFVATPCQTDCYSHRGTDKSGPAPGLLRMDRVRSETVQVPMAEGVAPSVPPLRQYSGELVGRKRPSFPSAAGVAGLLQAIAKFEGEPHSWRHVQSLLQRLSWIATPEANAALVGLFRSRKHIENLFPCWARILGQASTPEAEEELRDYLAGRMRHEYREPGSAAPLWRALVAYGNVDGELVEYLSSGELDALSSSRLEIIDAISGPVSDELRDAVIAQLDLGDQNASVDSAFKALIRLGDEASLGAAEKYMLTQPHGPRLAEEFGRRLTVQTAQELRGKAYRNPQVLSVYLAATSTSPQAVRQSEKAELATISIRALQHYDDESDPGHTHRRAVAGALLRMADDLDSPDLLEAMVNVIDGSPARMSALVDAANKIRDHIK